MFQHGLGEVLNDRETGRDICLTDILSRRCIILNLTVRKALEQALWEMRYLKVQRADFSAIPGGELHPQAVAPEVSDVHLLDDTAS